MQVREEQREIERDGCPVAKGEDDPVIQVKPSVQRLGETLSLAHAHTQPIVVRMSAGS